MAHDFANLLNVVGLNVEVLRTNPSDPAIAQSALAAIERAVQSGRHVAERLLGFARRRPLALVRVRLDKWLEAVEPLLAQAAGSRVALDVQVAPGLPEVVCDTGELDVALLNLVINARDAMAQSGRIALRAYPCDEESAAPRMLVAKPPRFVCLSVEDNGPGMAESVRRRALEPFYTTKGEAGTGLGLSQVYGFMHQIGGQVAIESAPGRGTAVHLYFPVAGVESGVQP
jgi:signal transduction histidine kinase